MRDTYGGRVLHSGLLKSLGCNQGTCKRAHFSFNEQYFCKPYPPTITLQALSLPILPSKDGLLDLTNPYAHDFQKSLIKDYTLNHTRTPIGSKAYSPKQDFCKLWLRTPTIRGYQGPLGATRGLGLPGAWLFG